MTTGVGMTARTFVLWGGVRRIIGILTHPTVNIDALVTTCHVII